jgi:hypothetical protein
MSEHIDKLRAMLEELQAELHGIESLDPQTREMLEGAKDELEHALHREETDTLESHSLIERLQTAGEDFNESHPALSRIVGNLIDVLGQMGI